MAYSEFHFVDPTFRFVPLTLTLYLCGTAQDSTERPIVRLLQRGSLELTVSLWQGNVALSVHNEGEASCTEVTKFFKVRRSGGCSAPVVFRIMPKFATRTLASKLCISGEVKHVITFTNTMNGQAVTWLPRLLVFGRSTNLVQEVPRGQAFEIGTQQNKAPSKAESYPHKVQMTSLLLQFRLIR